MTYENCLKYAKEYKEAGNDELAKFWEERAKNKAKLNNIVEEKPKPVKKTKSKKIKGNGNK